MNDHDRYRREHMDAPREIKPMPVDPIPPGAVLSAPKKADKSGEPEVIAQITATVREVLVRRARQCVTIGNPDERAFGFSVLDLDAFATAETARATEALGAVSRWASLAIEIAHAMGFNARPDPAGNAHVIERARYLSEQFTGDRYTATAKAENERDALRAKLAEMTKSHDQWFASLCEESTKHAATRQERDAAIRERDEAKASLEMLYGKTFSNRCYHALASRAEAAEARVVERTAEFKNFHRSLSDRFGYHHDQIDWSRDQISLEEWIAKREKALWEALVKVGSLAPGSRTINTAERIAREALEQHRAIAPTAPAPAPAIAKDDNRCATCGWPLMLDKAFGCVRGNCSMRPYPKNLYDAERHAREHRSAP